MDGLYLAAVPFYSEKGWLFGWSLTSLFSTNTAISEMKGQGWTVILLPTEGRLAKLAAFLYSSHPKREKDQEAYLNYYASAALQQGKTTIAPQN